MGLSSGKRGGLQAEINVTPLIDVLLVLLIIFLVVMPIMLHQETLDIPRQADVTTEPEPSITIFVKPDLSIEVSNDLTDDRLAITAAELSTALRPQLAKVSATTKVVFVDFDPSVPWREAIDTVDRIRSVATDREHDEIKVALKVHESDGAAR